MGEVGKEKEYSKYELRHKFTSNGTRYVQGKCDPLSNMWPVQLDWNNHTFSSSDMVVMNRIDLY